METKMLYRTLTAVALIILISSCLKNDVQERTAQDGVIDLNNYLESVLDEGYDIDTTASGVYYVIRQEGEGASPIQGDSLSISYYGYFINGVLFDSSDPDNSGETYELVFKDDPLIQGVEDGIELMNTGALHELIIPYHLAFGPVGTYVVPAYTPVIYILELHEIFPAN